MLFQMTLKAYKIFIQVALKLLIIPKIRKVAQWNETLFSDPH